MSVVAFAAFGDRYVNVDAVHSLVWGREIAHGHLPHYAPGPTPHPLSNLIAAALSPLGPGSEDGLLVIGYLATGVLGWATLTIAHEAFGLAAGVVALALLLTREVVAGSAPVASADGRAGGDGCGVRRPDRASAYLAGAGDRRRARRLLPAAGRRRHAAPRAIRPAVRGDGVRPRRRGAGRLDRNATPSRLAGRRRSRAGRGRRDRSRPGHAAVEPP
ncbi:hypothetical protein FSW04_03095 [Baekduia soli]|uniref:Uncharacterized protein n=1 Tax=Baekduia soli TaxID=496014 RepID=A0A5B8U102_9ACTN|nr:hypothetical protein [Baekduia soli]QEC46667.1 hypothetical protein FSW04_03095 [Baekduia soli]